MNTEKYCRACNERYDRDGHAEGCEIADLQQQLAQAREEIAMLLDLFIRTRDELWTLTGPTALTDEGKALIAKHLAKQE